MWRQKKKITPEHGQERSRKAETEFATHILTNATILKKLTQRIANRSFVEMKMGSSANLKKKQNFT